MGQGYSKEYIEMEERFAMISSICLILFIVGFVLLAKHEITENEKCKWQEVRIVDKYKDDEIFDDYFIRLNNGEIFEVTIHEYKSYNIGQKLMYHPRRHTIK